LAEDDRQGEGPLRRRDRLQYLWASEGNAVEEAQRADGLDHGSPGHLFVLEEKELIGADLLRAQVRGGSPKMPCEIGDTAEVAVHREGRVVAELHVFQHALAQGCHGQASHLHAWTPSGHNGDDRSVGVTLLTEESLWSRHMPEARWAQRWRGWEERKALYPNAVSGFVQEGLSEPVGVTEALATPVCNPVWRDGADCLSCRWDEVIPSGICVRKNPVSEGWQNWKERKETGQTFRKSGVLRLSGNKLPHPLAWLPRPLADNARLSAREKSTVDGCFCSCL
jgi:hypothetical protein